MKEQRLAHREAAEEFYLALAARGQQVRVGMEAGGQARWFERLLAELQFELWLGNAPEIRRKRGANRKRIGKMRSARCCPDNFCCQAIMLITVDERERDLEAAMVCF